MLIFIGRPSFHLVGCPMGRFRRRNIHDQPEGFIALELESKVSTLVKSLYGFKQAPKQWHHKFDHTMLETKFKLMNATSVEGTNSRYVTLCLYMDDMLIIGSNDKMIKSTKDMLKSKFDMKDMGLVDVIRRIRSFFLPSSPHGKLGFFQLGRLSLIKAVLGKIPTYFMSIYLMPVSIRSNLESMRSKFFRGADQNENKMSWVKWTKCLSSKQMGVLGIGVSMAKVEAFLMNPLLLSDWSTALRRFPRGGAEMTQFDDLKAVIGSVSLTDQRDTWQWSLDVAGGFSVASARAFVDDTMLEADFVATRWNHTIPIKLDVETVNHIFFNCEMPKDLWSLLAKWWDLDIPICANISEWYDWLDVVRVAAMARSALEGVGGTLFWSI
ncbi:RNA-directed DNA polymerase, eukaryota, reverse transcriptase zinc-binding domain protein [Tanacetum coccineum]